ncbi:MORC family CW-type zinc finger protein 4 [Sciurus carolinensis]|uniref:MORC family CW-type zinc finger protein 4 n=1 Tax=Sciurus carolinensis TaxID=30640 RepID=A0AA41MM28_SCICA|nr:MORC family CW-type zinc finger protein 4 [Sciurus carolinensis]
MISPNFISPLPEITATTTLWLTYSQQPATNTYHRINLLVIFSVVPTSDEMSPRYLQSNSSSHTRPFSAIAELLDNAVDPDVSARTVFIDVEEVKNKSCLTFTDDGCGMTPHKLHRMLSLEAILNYSIFNSENDLLSQFDAIPGKKGTRVLIWNIRRNKDGKSELDFDTDQYDILVSDFDAEEKEISGSELPETEYSLRPTHGEGVGVIGVIECNFLKPAYNKQDFEYTKEYRKIPDQTWVQCDECLKWRKLPGKVDPSTLPARWFCYYNSHPKYRDQSVEKKKIPMENENLQAFSNPPKIPSVQDIVGLNDKTIGYERIDSPTLLPSVGEESRSPSLQLKPLDSSVFQFSSKYKWILGEEPVEKRRRLQNEMATSPLDYSMPGSFRKVEAALAYPEGENSHDKSSSERSTPPCLFPEYPEASKNTGQNREVSVLYPGAQDQRQGSLLPEDLEDQMPRLVAEESNRGESNRGSTSINKEEVNKGPFVAVVGVAKGVRDSGAPIQLIPFNREELAERRKTVESWNPVPYSSVASAATPAAAIGEKGRGYEENGGRNTPKMKNQRELEELKRTTEKLERVLAERNLFQQKVEELEQERNHWHSEFKKVQHELVTYSTQETEGLYWSKKHMGYRQAEFQILKAELERTKEEKQELQEKLKETETHLEVLRKAQVSYRTPEGDDLERALAKLTRLRIHVSYLLTSVLPHLELREIGYDSEQVDGILYTVLEANHILD